MTLLNLRSYQAEALDAITKAQARGVHRPLVVHPTGTGKTVTFSHLIARRAQLGRSIVLVHRDELANQTVEKIGLVAPQLSVGIVKAERDEHAADVVVASVQTAHRDNRLERLAGFSTVVCDEAHHAPAPSWTKVLRHLGSFSGNGDGLLTVGFTATPERDGTKLGVWEEVVHYKSIREMIYQDYLVPITGQTVATSADFSKVRVSHGDFSEGDLGAALESSGALTEIADAYVAYAKDRRGVAFTPTVATAHGLAGELVSRGITAEAVDGTTPIELRRAILARLRSGATQVVANCAVLTEGFDEPSIECIVVARPTRFHGLYVQMVGRGTRRHPGKTDLLILDVTGASERHDLVAVVDLGISQRRPGEAQDPAEEGFDGPLCELCSRPLSLETVMQGGRRHPNCRAGRTSRIDPFSASKLRWLPVDDAFALPAGKDVILMAPVSSKPTAGSEVGGDGLYQLVSYGAGRITTLHACLPVDWAQGIGEDHAKAFGKLASRDARWLAEAPTPAQRNRLVREGLPEHKLPAIRTRGQAADLITRIQGRRALRKLTGA